MRPGGRRAQDPSDEKQPFLQPTTAGARYGLLEDPTRFEVLFPAEGWAGQAPRFEQVRRHPLMLPWNRYLSKGSDELGTILYYALRFRDEPVPRLLHAVSIRRPARRGAGDLEGAIHVFPGVFADWDFGDGKPFGIHHVTVRPTDRGTIRRYVRACDDGGNALKPQLLAETDVPMASAQYLMATCIRGAEDLWPAGAVTRSIDEDLAAHIKKNGVRERQAVNHFCEMVPMLPQPSFLMTIYALGGARGNLASILPFAGELYEIIFGRRMDFQPEEMRGAVSAYDLRPFGFERLAALHVLHLAIPRRLPRAAVIHVAGLGEKFADYSRWLQTEGAAEPNLGE